MKNYPQQWCGSTCAVAAATILLLGTALKAQDNDSVPRPLSVQDAWIDAATGHRVIRLTREDNSEALLYNVNAFTPDGADMVYKAPEGIYVLHLATRASHLVAKGKIEDVLVGTRSRRIFFTQKSDSSLYVVDISSQQTAKIATLPGRTELTTINADETLIAGTYMEMGPASFTQIFDDLSGPYRAARAMEQRLASKAPENLITVDIHTGHVNTLFHTTDWVSQVFFSPTDPLQLMFCHEGPPLEVDRLWTMRIDGKPLLVHQRTIPREVVVQEFWDTHGKSIWYDLQKPKGVTFFLSSYNLQTGSKRSYEIQGSSSSYHFAQSGDERFFAGDGKMPDGGHPVPDRSWIELLRPSETSGNHSPGQTEAGLLQREQLVDMSHHNYSALQPGVRFSPDNKSVIFTSNMFGPTYIFSVDISKAH